MPSAQWAEGNSLLKRVGHPEDVARTVLFLVDSDFATGGGVFRGRRPGAGVT